MRGSSGGEPNQPDGRRLRVLLLIKGLGLGGAERLVADLMANRDASRFDYEVAYVLGAQDALAGAVRDTGVPVHSLGAGRTPDLRWTLRLRRLLRAGEFDVVHAHLPYAAAFGRLVAATLPARRRPLLVYTEHSLWPKAAVLTKALNRATVGLDDALLVVSPTARDALPPALRDRATVVVHGIDRARAASLVERRTEVAAAVRAELAVAPGHVLALTVANLRAEKGHAVLVAAVGRLPSGGPPVRFVVAGDGPRRAELEAAAGAAGVADRLTFLGRRDDTLRLMAGADLFVLPSLQEGMPVALMEAMSVGLPVVASAVGGVPDVVTDGVDGILVPPGDVGALARALSQVTQDVGLRARLGGAALARSAAFDIADAARAIEALYERLVRRRRPGERARA